MVPVLSRNDLRLSPKMILLPTSLTIVDSAYKFLHKNFSQVFKNSLYFQFCKSRMSTKVSDRPISKGWWDPEAMNNQMRES